MQIAKSWVVNTYQHLLLMSNGQYMIGNTTTAYGYDPVDANLAEKMIEDSEKGQPRKVFRFVGLEVIGYDACGMQPIGPEFDTVAEAFAAKDRVKSEKVNINRSGNSLTLDGKQITYIDQNPASLLIQEFWV